jgi:malto-oligosyltrehalose trehalohydrolase
VRDFFIHNVLYWLEEYHFDGLRLDAVHAIKDDSRPDMLEELATQVHDALACDRHLHLVLENDHNATRYLQRTSEHRPRFYTAQWNDDFHHAAHVLATGENDGYYQDYSSKPEWHLGRCLAEGFSFQGEASVYRSGQPRGEPCTGLPATAFVSFLQNHDQVGNRAFGERLIRLCDADTLKALVAVMLLAPSPPLLFMGEEFGANTPFLFFCDFEPDLAAQVTQGRRSEFGDHKEFRSPPAQAKIPDPSSESTFLSSKLDWNSLTKAGHLEWLQFYRNLLHLRQKEIVPLLQRLAPERANFEVLSHGTVSVRWPFHDNGALALLANFSKAEIRIPECPKARILYPLGTVFEGISPAQSVIWFLEE